MGQKWGWASGRLAGRLGPQAPSCGESDCPPVVPPSLSARLRVQVLIFTGIRALINTGYRMVYPFLPTLARGLGVDVATVALAVTARSSLGFFGPAFGALADRWGRRVAMLFGLGVVVTSLLLISLLPVYAALLVGLLLLSAGKIVFDSTLQAYLGDRVHYARRGQAIGLVEIGWSAAFLVGVPLAGWLIAASSQRLPYPGLAAWLPGASLPGWSLERLGWNAPFPWLAALILAAALLLGRMLPPDAPHAGTRPPLLKGIRAIASRRAALAGLAISLLISGANETVGIVFGVWMEGAFGLPVAALGAASMAIGLAELGGEGLVAGLADRLGKRRAVALGLGGSVLTALALPVLGGGLGGGLVGLFLFYLAFEFTLVTTIALMTELAPQTRATLMAANIAFQSIGRALGAPLGTALFTAGLAGGVTANSLAAALWNGAALILLLRFVRPTEHGVGAGL